mmetsp:Transcript_55262/g.134234  ORF Transcript_55262/g.134234 Transcript_55262/m.134234 type:complete len:218 (+) Transcript_55262:349-1002(+)
MTMNISPLAPIGNKIGPTVNRIDFATYEILSLRLLLVLLLLSVEFFPVVVEVEVEDAANVTIANDENRIVSPNDQHATVNKCCQHVHGILEPMNCSTPYLVHENNKTAGNGDFVNPNKQLTTSTKLIISAIKTAGRSCDSQKESTSSVAAAVAASASKAVSVVATASSSSERCVTINPKTFNHDAATQMLHKANHPTFGVIVIFIGVGYVLVLSSGR